MNILARLNLAERYRHYTYRSLAKNAGRIEYDQQSVFREGYSSQCGQDKWLAEVFYPGLREGVFVDIGAHDGISFSNTFYLESSLGWSGLAIEPLPDIFQKLSENRTCIKVNGCISSHTGLAKFRKITGYSEMLSGLVDQYDPRHQARIEEELVAHGGKFEEIPVRCYRLNDLLDQHGIGEVHYLNIDVEGAEYEILQSIDFQAHNIRLCGIENNYNDFRIPKLMKKMGYEMIAIVGDEFYVKSRK